MILLSLIIMNCSIFSSALCEVVRFYWGAKIHERNISPILESLLVSLYKRQMENKTKRIANITLSSVLILGHGSLSRVVKWIPRMHQLCWWIYSFIFFLCPFLSLSLTLPLRFEFELIEEVYRCLKNSLPATGISSYRTYLTCKALWNCDLIYCAVLLIK